MYVCKGVCRYECECGCASWPVQSGVRCLLGYVLNDPSVKFINHAEKETFLHVIPADSEYAELLTASIVIKIKTTIKDECITEELLGH